MKHVDKVLLDKGYEIVKFINNGSFGLCYLVRSINYNQDFVCKVSISEFQDPKFLEKITCEAEILSKLNHPNIIRIYDYFVEFGQFYMILEYCSGGNLYEIVHNKADIDPKKLMKYANQIIEALHFMHNKSVAHCDIKLSNILLDQFDRIKICDFGLSHFVNKCELVDGKKGLRGTLNYLAPEIILGFDYDPYKSDVWALGVTLFCMITKHFPFNSVNATMLLTDIHNGKGKLDPTSGQLARIVNMCFEPEPTHRPSMAMVRLKMSEMYTCSLANMRNKSCQKTLVTTAKNRILTLPRKRLSSSFARNSI